MILEYRTQNTEHRMQNAEYRIQNTEHISQEGKSNFEVPSTKQVAALIWNKLHIMRSVGETPNQAIRVL